MTSSGTKSAGESEASRSISLDDTDGWIFDLDGVLTDTASLHEHAWTELFQHLFDSMSSADPTPAAFTGYDYRRLVDGEDRMDGVRNVLADRQISLPEGTPDDPVGTKSVYGLAKEKDNRYVDMLKDKGPRPFPSSVDLLRRLKAMSLKVAVVSASRHCAEVLEAAGLTTLVDVRVDGYVAQEMRLAGKPDPALFLEAAHQLGVEPSRSVVFEDAIAGVEAGRRGGFSRVVGVDRNHQADALRRAGADIVVADLSELVLTGSPHSRANGR